MQKVVQLLRLLTFHKQGKRFFPILFTTLTFVLPAKSQDLAAKKVSLNIQGVSIKAALMEVQKQSAVKFIYDHDIDKYNSIKITLSEKETSVKRAIELIIKNTNLQFVQIDDHVMVNEKPAPKSPNASAGQGPGTVKGRIVEFETSQPLPGASVYILELKKGIISDNNGFYKFSNIAAGKYTLQISYVSFTTEKVQVEIKADKEETFDIKMRGSNSLSEVVVSGTRKTRAPVSHTTERQLVGELKAAQSVVSGISSEQISKSADRNAAEAVRRIAGVTVKDDKFIIIRGMNERYNLTYLNGNIAPSTELYSRAFSLDLIPSRIIDRILVYKSPAPDLLADMTGGAVKIFTKDAKNVKHLDVEFQTGYRENTTFNKHFLTYAGSGTDFLGFDNGTRKLPSSVPGFGDFTKANISQATYAKTFSNILTYGEKTAMPPVQLTVNYYDNFKIKGKNISFLTSFSYKNEPQHQDVDRTQGNLTYPEGSLRVPLTTSLSKISTESQNTEIAQLSLLQNFTYHLKDSSNLYFKNFLMQQGQSATILQNTTTDQVLLNGAWTTQQGSDAGKALRNIILSYQQRFLYSGNLGGSHYFGKGGKQQLDWNAGYTYSRLDIPDQRVMRLQNALTLPATIRQQHTNYTGDYEQNWIPVFRSEDNQTVSSNNVELGMISRVWIRNTESVYNGAADYTYKWKPWVTFKAGMYQQWKERLVFRRVYTVNEGDLPASGYPDPRNPAIGGGVPYMDNSLVFWHQQDLGKVWSNDYLRDDGTALKVFDRTSGSDAYTATEQNNSAYAAISLLPFNGKLDIYGGLRVEYNRQKVAGAIAPLTDAYNTGGVNTPVLADLKATLLLPSLNVGYRPNNSFVFRGAYGQTVNRPEFRELAPYSELDYVNNQAVAGNPNLVSARINNYDLRMEWYPHGNTKGETISLGGFYKQLDHPIERVIYQSLNKQLGAAPAAISFQNAEKAIVRGAELDIRKSLDFLPGRFFRDLSVIGNYTYIYSKVDSVSGVKSGQKSVNRQLQGQSPYTFNAGMYYENAGSGTKIAVIYNQVGPSIYAASVGQVAKGANSDGSISPEPGDVGSLLQLTRRQLDFSLTQRIVKSLQAKFSIQNLLNSPIQLADDANYTYKYEKASITYPKPATPGAPTYGRVNGDLLASDYKSGRFFLLSFTYGF